MKRIKMLVLLATLLAGLSMTGLALAQASNSFDLGCSGVFSGAGGVLTSPNYRVYDSLSQTAAGRASSTNYRLLIGHVQSWGVVPRGAVQTAVAPAQPGDTTLYFPFVAKFVRIVRQCSW
jgi:hypothetical protein